MGIQNLSSVQSLKLNHDIQMQKNAKSSGGFAEILNQRLEENSVQFSKHAMNRMQERGVDYTETLHQDLNNAIERARLKGAKDVVVIGQQSAFIVNVPNNTVITTMNATEMKENIFTNIDSAVIM